MQRKTGSSKNFLSCAMYFLYSFQIKSSLSILNKKMAYFIWMYLKHKFIKTVTMYSYDLLIFIFGTNIQHHFSPEENLFSSD